ncbi:hypothetical protein [Rhizobium leguminosarum]|uniref:hypothetical protein n=1 Tax=Rhizobium leguminosarum TaxID=384 RepID=UPI001FE00954|nr:hypothetical protein [Rhizobium leguminosarum]
MTFACIYKFFMDWQTLIGSLLALGAALLTVKEMRNQSRGDETRHRNELERKRMAARAQMPDALSEMSSYIRASTAQIVTGGEMPVAPVAALNTLKTVIEHIDTGYAEKTFQLVSWYQVQHVRMLASTNRNAHDTADQLFDAALLQAYVNRLFNYARNEKEEIGPKNLCREDLIDSLKSSLSLQVWAARHGEFPDVIEIINRRYKPRAQTE